MYSNSRFSGWPGRAGWVGYLRWRIYMPVFSSQQITKRPCWYLNFRIFYLDSCPLFLVFGRGEEQGGSSYLAFCKPYPLFRLYEVSYLEQD